MAASLFCGVAARADSTTDVRPAPGGKRLLFVDGNDIRPEPGGKKILTIDDHDIRPGAGGKSLLYIDGDDVRDKSGGIRIAIWDGHTLRRRPGGKVLLVIDGDDVRLEAGGKRLYFLDGAKLSTEQLTAVLYQLKPELFTLTAEEKATLQKEFAAAEAESDAQASQDQLPGTYRIITATTSDDKPQKGSVTVTKQGKYYAVAFDTGETPAWKGIGAKHMVDGDTMELWAAVGPDAAVSLGLYEAANGKLTGTWVPVNASDNAAVLGNETLIGPATGGGAYKIESGQLPNGGVKYTGAMNIVATDLPLLADAKSYEFRWATGTTGAGFSMDNSYAVGVGWGADYRVMRLRFYLGNLTGEFIGKKNHGSYMLSK